MYDEGLADCLGRKQLSVHLLTLISNCASISPYFRFVERDYCETFNVSCDDSSSAVYKCTLYGVF